VKDTVVIATYREKYQMRRDDVWQRLNYNLY